LPIDDPSEEKKAQVLGKMGEFGGVLDMKTKKFRPINMKPIQDDF
jgi:hypothetical protein